MISRNDVILLLTELEERGLDIQAPLKKTLSSASIPLDVVRFINSNRQLDLSAFYEKIRKAYNQKRSKLYLSIVQEITDPTEVVNTLHSYGLQTALFAKQNAQDSQMFLRHARAREVAVVLSKYYTDYDLTNCIALLRLIKADIVACETVSGRREEQDHK